MSCCTDTLRRTRRSGGPPGVGRRAVPTLPAELQVRELPDHPVVLLAGHRAVLVGVVAQRLVRMICPHCKMDSFLTHDQVLSLNIQGAEGRQLKVCYGAGCPKCRGTGYMGRTGVFEVMPINERIRELIDRKASAEEIKREALSEGMIPLRDYAIKKMAMGVTTYDEVFRVTTE